MVLVVCVVGLAGCGAVEGGEAQADAEGTRTREVIRTGPPAIVSGPLTVDPGGITFGKIPPDTEFLTELTLRNTSGIPINITEVQSSCHCTVPENLEGAVIDPHSSYPFRATFHSPGKPGLKSSKILIKFEYAGRKGHALFELQGEVMLAVVADPPYVDALKGVSVGRIKLRSFNGAPFRVVSSNQRPPVFADGYDPSIDAPRNAYTVQWRLDYPTSTDDCDRQRIWWVIETDHADCPVLPLRIRHECTGLLIDPDWEKRNWIFREYMVNVGAVKAGTSIEVEVALRNWDSVPVHTVESLSPDATAELLSTADPEGELTTCRVRFTPRKGFEGLLYAPVNFRSDRGDMDMPFLVRVLPD